MRPDARTPHEADRGEVHRDNSHAVPPEAVRRPPGPGPAVAPDTGPASKERSNSPVGERGDARTQEASDEVI